MFVGTGSDVGKSILATAFCRIFRQDGYRPAPFKAQNMALNSFVTADGGEIGRAQAEQARAAGIDCLTDMNPLLLKPCADHTSQVILNGRPIGNYSARQYYEMAERDDLRRQVYEAFQRLQARYSPIVLEGAGSISELNLISHDLVNMSMAQRAEASVILVADIDRGGVFASAYGSIMLQSPEHRALIRGIIVNKFRGDISLFDRGRQILQDICGVPVLGVVPYMPHLDIDAEDSVALDRRYADTADTHDSDRRVEVCVVHLPHISNFTDFAPLERDARIRLTYATQPSHLDSADIIILPGTKTTIDDLCAIRLNGLADAIVRRVSDGTPLIAICGGYQMAGRTILDPHGVESSSCECPGLGLLPVVTTLTPDKVTRRVSFHMGRATGQGYEIHMGRTVTADTGSCTPAMTIDPDMRPDGCRKGSVIGTYVHGLFDSGEVIDMMLQPFGFEPGARAARSFRDAAYDRLADHVRAHVDVDAIYQILQS